MTVENTQDNTQETTGTELKPKFQALPKCLLVNEHEMDELQPEPTNTPRPRQSA